jgi:hypothetical protein
LSVQCRLRCAPNPGAAAEAGSKCQITYCLLSKRWWTGLSTKVSEIRSYIQTKFTISPEELTQKQRNGCTRFVNHVAWALSSLNTAEGRDGHILAITRVKEEVYKITDYGKRLLRKSLTVADLIRFDPPTAMRIRYCQSKMAESKKLNAEYSEWDRRSRQFMELLTVAARSATLTWKR